MSLFTEALYSVALWSKASIDSVRGLYMLKKLNRPIITIFGGKRATKENGFVKQAYELSRLLVQKKFAVITGGGPGIMQAANCGAASVHEKKKNDAWTLGIGVHDINENYDNPCTSVISVNSFYVRKWLLTEFASGYVFFPGGIGTADELFELLNLKKHSQLVSRPIILIDQNYWQPLITWYIDRGIKEGFITVKPAEAFSLCNTIEQAVSILERIQAK